MKICFLPRAGLWLALSLLASSSTRAELVFAQTQVALTAGPQDSVLVAEYPFTNTGSEPVTVLKTTASCGCTVPELAEDVIAPGGRGVLRASFTIGGRTGPQIKDIEVETDENTYHLQLSVEIPPRVNFTRRVFLWQPGESAPVTQEMQVNTDLPAEIIEVQCANPAFTVEVIPTTPGEIFAITVSLTAPIERDTRGILRVRYRGPSGQEYAETLVLRCLR